MTSRKPTTEPTAADIRARKIKLIEGGIVFTLIFGLCVFLGIHFAGPDREETVTAQMTAPDFPAPSVVVEHEPMVASTSAMAADDGTEPVAVADVDAASGGVGLVGEPLPIEEILPEVPILVTYSDAEATFREGRFGQAAAMFASYCDEHPGNAWGHYMRGLSLWKADRDQEAATAFAAALAIKSDHRKSLVNLARVQLELDDPELALGSIEQALDIAPGNADARRVLGRVYHQLGRLDEAVAAYTEALGQNADDAWSLNNLALVWIERERFDLALAPLARAIELAPEAAVIRNNLGVALERTGHLTAAREQFALAANSGSAKGELSLIRLDELGPVDAAPAIDLAALAASWSLAVPGQDPAALPTDATVAAVTAEEADLVDQP